MRKRKQTAIAFRLQRAMDRQKYDGRSLAAASGVSTSSISTYLNNRAEPTRRTAARLAAVLGVSTEWLVGIAPLDAEHNEGMSQETLVKLYESLNDKGKRYLIETAVLLTKVQQVA